MTSLLSVVPAARTLLRSAVVGSAAVALVLGSAAVASAAPGITASDDTTANVEVTSSITLSITSPDFTLTGIPGATVTEASAVDYNVQTNNFAGYSVSVQATAALMTPARAGNADRIAVGNLSVQPTGTDPAAFTALSNVTSVPLRSKATRSAPAGDDYSDDYRVLIPFVNEDVYSVDLTYLATTL